MKYPTSAWDRSSYLLQQRDRWFERLSFLGLLLAALLLWGCNLGAVPLSDGPESMTAQLAREIARAPAGTWGWLFPTLNGEPYLTGAPLVPALVAALYPHLTHWTWVARLPGALLGALSVPLLYGLGRELFPMRLPALFTALFYLTLLPVIRQSRLAGPGGAALCLMVLALWCALRSRRDWRWALGLGISLGLLSLAHGGTAVVIAGVVLIFLAWDTPRLLRLPRFWVGLALGLAPAITWYAAQGWRAGSTFADQLLAVNLWLTPPSLVPWRHGLWPLASELLGLSVVLAFCWTGFPWLRSQLHWSWGKLSLVWLAGGGAAIAASLLLAQPVLLTALYPALSLAAGAFIAEIWQQPQARAYPRSWVWSLLALGLAAMLGSLAFSSLEPHRAPTLVLVATALTLSIVALLLDRRDRQFSPILFWGQYVTLLMLVSSPYWLWQPPHASPVRPAAAIVRYATPADQPVYASLAAERNSLNFYSDRRVLPATPSELRRLWQSEAQPYFLLDTQTLTQLALPNLRKLASAYPDWTLVTKAPSDGLTAESNPNH